MVLNVSECKNQRSYELVVAVSCLSAFLKDRRGFRLNSHYNPTEPAEGDGTPEAKRRAQTGFLHNAVKAIRGGKGPGPEVCYRDAARLDGLKVALERAILVWDILVRHPHIDPPTYLLMIFRSPILRSLSVSHKTSHSFVSISSKTSIPLLPLISFGETKMVGSNHSGTGRQIYPSHWLPRTLRSRC